MNGSTPKPADVISRPPLSQFQTTGIAPPGAIYFSREDELVIFTRSFTNTETLFLSTRLMRSDGQLVTHQQTVPISTGYGFTETHVKLAEGFLLSATLGGGGPQTQPGDLYCLMFISRGGLPLNTLSQLLASGYVNTFKWISFPGDTHRGPLEGPGLIRSITGTDPAAGVEISETVPTLARWRLIAVRAALTTDATAGNRFASIILDDGVTTYYQHFYPTFQGPSTAVTYNFSALAIEPAVIGNNTLVPFPPNLRLSAGHRIRTQTSVFNAGDNWGAPQLLVEQWLED